MFGAVKLIKNAGSDKYRHGGYDFGFDEYSQFSWADGSWGKNVVILGVQNVCHEIRNNVNPKLFLLV